MFVRLSPVALVVLLSVGCASYEAKPLRPREATAMLNQDNYNNYGLAFAAQLPPDSEYVVEHYCFHLPDYNLLPVEVFLENSSEDANFEIRVSQAEFTLADGTEFVSVPLDEAVERLSWSGWMSLPWWFFPAFPIFSGLIAMFDTWDQNALLEDDYTTKILSDRNIAPRSKPVQGVILFRPKDPETHLSEIEIREATVSLRVTMRSATGPGDTFTTQILFSGTHDLWND